MTNDNWLNHNTDKLLLYSLVVLGGSFMMHVIHHGGSDAQLMTWLENAFSTVLGALILILTGRVQRANGGTSVTPTTTIESSAPTVIAPVTGPVVPTV